MHKKINLPQNIKYYRELHNLSQKELANIIGVSSQTISLFERNRREVKLKYLVPLADVFGITIDELVFSEHSVFRCK